MAIIDDILPDGNRNTRSGIGLHLYPGGVKKYEVSLMIELQRAFEVSGVPGTYVTIAHLQPGPQPYMDIARAIKRIDSGSDRKSYYRARMTGRGLTPSAWSQVDEGVAKEHDAGYQLPPVPSYPKIGIDQREVANDPTKASVTLRATPQHVDTVIKYQVLADTAAIPPRTDGSWNTYSGAFLVTRSDTNVQKIVAFGELNGIYGNFYVQEVATDRVPAVLNITLDVSGTGVVSMEVTTDADSGSIRYAKSTSAYPDKATTQAGTVANGRNITVASLHTLSDGETLYVSVLPYSQTGGAGIEGELARANVTYTASTSTNRVESAEIQQRGETYFLVVTGGSGMTSFKWAIQTGSFPAAGTGTCVNSSTGRVDVSASVPNYNTTYYVTITPYPSASCGGSAGDAYNFTFDRLSEPGLFDDDTGWLGDTGVLAQRKFENDANEILGLSTAGTGDLIQPSGYSPSDDNNRTFWDKQNQHSPNQTTWGGGSVYAHQVRFSFSFFLNTGGVSAQKKVFVAGDLVDGTFWDGATGNGIYITVGGTNQNQFYIYKRVAGVDTQIGAFMQTVEQADVDYVEIDVIIYEFNPVKLVVATNGKFQNLSATGLDLSGGFYFGLMMDEAIDPSFKNIEGRSEMGPFFSKRLIVGDLDSIIDDAVKFGIADATPSFYLDETDASVDNRIWGFRANAENLEFGALDDTQAAFSKWLSVARTTTVIDQIALFPSSTGGVLIYPGGSAHVTLTEYPGEGLTIYSDPCYMGFHEHEAAVDAKRWIIGASGEDFLFRALNDAGTSPTTIFWIDRGASGQITVVGTAPRLKLNETDGDDYELIVSASELYLKNVQDNSNVDCFWRTANNTDWMTLKGNSGNTTGFLEVKVAMIRLQHSANYVFISQNDGTDGGGWHVRGSAGAEKMQLARMSSAAAWEETILAVDLKANGNFIYNGAQFEIQNPSPILILDLEASPTGDPRIVFQEQGTDRTKLVYKDAGNYFAIEVHNGAGALAEMIAISSESTNRRVLIKQAGTSYTQITDGTNTDRVACVQFGTAAPSGAAVTGTIYCRYTV